TGVKSRAYPFFLYDHRQGRAGSHVGRRGCPVNLGRDSLPWSQDRWDQLDLAIHEEAKRTGVAASLLPLVGPFPNAIVVPADEIRPDQLAIDEGRNLPLVEVGVPF